MHVAIADITPSGLRQAGPWPQQLRVRLGKSLAAGAMSLDGQYDVVVSGHGGKSSLSARFAVVGDVAVTGQLPCSGCLAPAKVDFHVPIDVGVVPVEAEPEPLPGGELTPEAVELYTYEGERLDLEPLLHDEVVMAIPLRLLCKPDCRGLCPHCGVDLNAAAGEHDCHPKQPSGPFAKLATFRSQTPPTPTRK